MLLIWIMVLVVFVAGYQVYRDEQSPATGEPSSAALADACTDAINAQLATIETPECPEPENPAYDGGNSLPSFTYPLGWHLYVLTQGTTQYLLGDDAPIAIRSESEGPNVPLRITSHVITTGETPTETYLLSLEDAAIYSNIAKTSARTANGTLTIVTGHMNGLSEQDFETYFFEGTTHVAEVTFFDVDGSATTANAGWAIIEPTLNFSAIN